jgi:hypothetical protein
MHWYVFGVHHDGTVDIVDRLGDIATRIDPDEAERLIDRHNKQVGELKEMYGRRSGCG